jgi:hypothetical protein
MPSSEYAPFTGGDPLAPLAELMHWLLNGAIHLFLGLVLGLVTARIMRRRRLHWAWSACALPVLLILHLVFSATATLLLVGALLAMWLSRRWHLEDLEAGADLARGAALRNTPWSMADRLFDRTIRAARAGAPAGWWRGDEVVVGHDRSGREISMPIGGPAGGTHTLVVGAAGSGKTVTQTWIARRSIERGLGVIVIDPKDDPQMRSAIRRAAEDAGRSFYEWTPQGPVLYNPYARGSETEIADKVLAAERFTEPHYLRQAQRYLGHAVRTMRRAGVQVSLGALVHHLDPLQLELLARELPQAHAADVHAYLDSLTPRQSRDLTGVRDRLAIMAESDIGRWLEPALTPSSQLDLLEAIQSRSVALFSLEADRRPLLAQMLAAAIVQDLQTAVAGLQGRPVPSLVVIDEFSALATEQVVRLFGRARSAGMSLLLGTQELCDLRLPGREALLEQVLGNLSVLIAHRQVVPASTELIASLGGTEGAWRATQHSNGGSTRTRILRTRLEQEQLSALGQGWAAVIGLVNGTLSIGRILR